MAAGYRPPHPPRAEGLILGRNQAYFPEADGHVDCPVYDRYALAVGAVIEGPALIQEDESTTVLGPAERARIDAFGNLVAELLAQD